MMKKWLCTLMVAGFAASTWAGSTKTVRSISYYPEGFKGSGNLDYRNERCKLDVTYPTSVKNYSTVVWFHGGGIAGGNKYTPTEITKKNIAVVAVNYRLSGARASCPDYLEDTAAAIAWTLEHIAEYGGDPGKVFVSGHSAGGYLSTMVAYDASYLKMFGHQPAELAGALPVSGQMSTHFTLLNERKRRGEGDNPPLLIDSFSPLYHASPTVPPTVFFVGDTAIEWPARPEENAYLEARLRRVYSHPYVKIYALPGFTHGSIVAPAYNLICEEIGHINEYWSHKRFPTLFRAKRTSREGWQISNVGTFAADLAPTNTSSATLIDGKVLNPGLRGIDVLYSKTGTLAFPYAVPADGTYKLIFGLLPDDASSATIRLNGTPLPHKINFEKTAAPVTASFADIALSAGVSQVEIVAAGGVGVNAIQFSPKLRTIPASDWSICGPFPSPWNQVQSGDNVRQALDTVYPPETNPDLKAEFKGEDGAVLKWRVPQMNPQTKPGSPQRLRTGSPSGDINIAMTTLTCDRDRTALLHLSADWWAQAKLNGVMLETSMSPAAVAKTHANFNGFHGTNSAVLHLKKGRNTLLVKVHGGSGGSEFAAAISDVPGIATHR
jgi:acetyl esterase/lipase